MALFLRHSAMPSAQNISGKAIKACRQKLGLSQEELAAKCQLAGWDIGRGVIAKVETGIRCVTDIELVRFSKILDEPILNLLTVEKPAKKARNT